MTTAQAAIRWSAGKDACPALLLAREAGLTSAHLHAASPDGLLAREVRPDRAAQRHPGALAAVPGSGAGGCRLGEGMR